MHDPSSSMLDLIRHHLERNGVPYREIGHTPAASAEEYQRVLGTRLEQQAKCLLVQLKRSKRGPSEYALVTVPAQKRVDLDRISEITGASVRLADRDQLARVTGCRFGELPPIGSIMKLPLFMDRELLSEAEIYFNAGRLDRSMAASPVDIAKLEQATLI